MKFYFKYFCISVSLFVLSCEKADVTITEKKDNVNSACIERVDGSTIGLSFVNQINETEDINILNYEYLYNGGGVGVADFDNDGFQDLIFTGSLVDDKIFKNNGKGNFDDVTKQSGIKSSNKFSTGVTICDVNNDGLKDIYISKTGKGLPVDRANELWVNKGNFNFKEEASKFGIDSKSHSNHAAFLDIDLDGDLDLFVMNHPIDFKNSQKIRIEFEKGEYIKDNKPKTKYDSDQLFLNDRGIYKDVTESYGISNYGYGLSVSINDVNEDGYPDIFISNDYIEPDKLYINQQGKGFKDEIEQYFSHLSENSMGSIFDDFDNDGDQDLLVVDMVSDDLTRQKQLISSMTHSRYKYLDKVGYHPQHMRNVLQVNNGFGKFSECAQAFDVSNTDWSWTPLFVDLDNNGYRDLFVSNGYYRDLTDCDYTNYKSDSLSKSNINSIKSFVSHIPQTPVNNSFFLNGKDGLSKNVLVCNEAPSFSNGSAYIDIDNDGRLEIVSNNIDSSSYIYIFSGDAGKFVSIELVGPRQNLDAFGTKVEIIDESLYQQKILQSTDGYFSSSDQRIYFGLGNFNKDSVQIKITWPDNSISKSFVKLDQKSVLDYNTLRKVKTDEPSGDFGHLAGNHFEHVDGLVHVENEFDDLSYDHIMPHCFSNLGPTLSTADLDEEGTEDMFFGSSKNSYSSILMNGKDIIKLTDSKLREDVESVFYDLDNDGDQDLLVGFSDNQSKPSLENYGVVIYENVNGILSVNGTQITERPISVGSISVGDFNGDNLPDIFVGAYVSIRAYPKPPKSLVLINKGDLEFEDGSKKIGGDLINAGMITDSKYIDLDKDGKFELVLCGEFTPISIYDISGGEFSKVENKTLDKSNGWWRAIEIIDLNNDGHLDIIGGNYGVNHRYHASVTEPYTVFHADFDQNGTYDAIPSKFYKGELSPILQRGDLLKELALLQRVLKDYSTYSSMSTEGLLRSIGAVDYDKSLVYDFKSAVFFGTQNNDFRRVNLPSKYQMSNIYDIKSAKINGTNLLFFGGNNSCTNVEYGPFDAGYNYILKYENESFVELNKSKNTTFDEIRSIIIDNKKSKVIYGMNDDGVKTLSFDSVF